MSTGKGDLIYVFGYSHNRRESGVRVDPMSVLSTVAEMEAQHEKTIVVMLKDGAHPVAYLMSSAHRAT